MYWIASNFFSLGQTARERPFLLLRLCCVLSPRLSRAGCWLRLLSEHDFLALAVLKSNALRKTLGLPLLGLGAATPATPEPAQMFTSKPPQTGSPSAASRAAAPAGPVTYDVSPLPEQPSAKTGSAVKRAKRKPGRSRKGK